MVFDLLFFCVTVKTISEGQPLLNVANAIGNIANAFENNYGALESVPNGLKKVVTHFQCIFQRLFDVFSSYDGFSQVRSQID